MHPSRSLLCGLLAALVLSVLPAAAPQARAADSCRTFPETGQSLCGAFLTYWESHGGLAQQGYPISGEYTGASELNGKPYATQMFERAMFEKHPENSSPYDILLSQLGAVRYHQKYPQGAPNQLPAAGGILFGQTGKRLGGRFLTYWQAHGGVAQQGYPVSDEFPERSDVDGKVYQVQYFERAVFEYHAENAAPYDVLLTPLGRLHAAGASAPAAAAPAAAPAAPAPAPASAGTFMKGMNYVSWYAGGFGSGVSDQSLGQLAATGANTIGVVVTGYQDNINSTTINWTGARTPSDADLAHVIATAHSRGLRVLLKPHVDLANDGGHWRGQIGQGFNEGQWQAWFAAYRDFIGHYAGLARAQGADLFCVGTELVATSGRDADWRGVISAVRSRFAGPLTYASNWGGDETRIGWWDALDYIGVDAYYPLSDKTDPSVAELQQAWVSRGYVNTLQGLSTRFNRPVVLTEIGYGSVAGTSRKPAEWQQGGPLDVQEQANAYQAAFNAFWGRPWLAGMFWWSWDADSITGGAGDRSYTPHNKPAEQVLRSFYGGR
jgi:hypothetical protein